MKLILTQFSGTISVKFFKICNQGYTIIINEADEPFKSCSVVLIDRVNSLKSISNDLELKHGVQVIIPQMLNNLVFYIHFSLNTLEATDFEPKLGLFEGIVR